MEKFKQNPLVKKLGFNRIVLCGVLILMYIFFSILVPNVTGSQFAGMSHIMGALNYAYFL